MTERESGARIGCMTDNLSKFFPTPHPPVSQDKVCNVGFKGCSAELIHPITSLETAVYMYEVLLNEERK